MNRFARALGAALSAVVAQPVAAEVVEQNDGFFVTRDSVTVRADPRETWLALISPGKWWADEHTWSGDSTNMSIMPQGGGCFCERIPETDTPREVGLAGSVQHMSVVQAYPMKVLRMRGELGPLQSEPVDGVMTITLQAVPEGTRVVMEYVVGGRMRYEGRVISGKVDEVLSAQLAGLGALLGRVDQPTAAARPDEQDPANVEDALDAMGAKKPGGNPPAEPDDE